MPLPLKAQNDKAASTIKQQLKYWSPSAQRILDYELAGLKPGKIAEKVDMGIQRVSQIRTSPIYIQHREVAMERLQKLLLQKKSVEISNIDPVMKVIRLAAMDAAVEKIRLMKEGKSEIVRNAACSDVLDRAGYKPETRQIITSVEVTNDMAGRWEKTLGKRTKRVTGIEINES